jgi:hypothetical protein
MFGERLLCSSYYLYSLHLRSHLAANYDIEVTLHRLVYTKY